MIGPNQRMVAILATLLLATLIMCFGIRLVFYWCKDTKVLEQRMDAKETRTHLTPSKCPVHHGYDLGFSAPHGIEAPMWMQAFELSKASAEVLRVHDGQSVHRTWIDSFSPFVSVRHHLVFCTTAKIASSGWLKLLRRMEGHAQWMSNPYFNRKSVIEGRPTTLIADLTQIKHYDDARRTEMLFGDQFLRVVVVRDPAERMLSAYLDKVANAADNAFQLAKYAKDLHLPDVSSLASLSFAEFVERSIYNLRRGILTDQHWGLQSANCNMQAWAPQYTILHTKNDGEDVAWPIMLQCILNLLRSKSPHPDELSMFGDTFGALNAPSKAGHATGSSNRFVEFYTPELLRRVTVAYAKDYSLFQLPVPVL